MYTAIYFDVSISKNELKSTFNSFIQAIAFCRNQSRDLFGTGEPILKCGKRYIKSPYTF